MKPSKQHGYSIVLSIQTPKQNPNRYLTTPVHAAAGGLSSPLLPVRLSKRYQARGHVIVLHKLCARDQKTPLGVAGLDLCFHICGVLPIHLVQSSSFHLGVSTLATNQERPVGAQCQGKAITLSRHPGWLLVSTSRRE